MSVKSQIINCIKGYFPQKQELSGFTPSWSRWGVCYVCDVTNQISVPAKPIFESLKKTILKVASQAANLSATDVSFLKKLSDSTTALQNLHEKHLASSCWLVRKIQAFICWIFCIDRSLPKLELDLLLSRNPFEIAWNDRDKSSNIITPELTRKCPGFFKKNGNLWYEDRNNRQFTAATLFENISPYFQNVKEKTDTTSPQDKHNIHWLIETMKPVLENWKNKIPAANKLLKLIEKVAANLYRK